MPNELGETFLRSDKVIVPHENIEGGRQVSSIVVVLGGNYAAYDLIDRDDRYLGPVALRKSKLSSDQIKVALRGPDSSYEEISPKKVNFIMSSFLLDNQFETVIEGIDFFGADGRTLKLRREGAAYPYGLVLETR